MGITDIFNRAAFETADFATGNQLDGAIEMGVDDFAGNVAKRIDAKATEAGLGAADTRELHEAVSVLAKKILPGMIKDNALSIVGGEDGDMESKAMAALVKEYPKIKSQLADEGITLSPEQLSVLKSAMIEGGQETGEDLNTVEGNVDMAKVVPVLGGGGPGGP